MQLLLHLRLYVGFGLIVGGGSLRKMPNWPFQTALDVPSVFKKHAGFRCEFRTLLVGEECCSRLVRATPMWARG